MGEYLYELKAGKKEEIGRKEQKMSLQQKQMQNQNTSVETYPQFRRHKTPKIQKKINKKYPLKISCQ